MSKIALTPNASGTGTLTIAAPNTSTDRTLTLPDETGDVVVTDGTTLFVDNTNNNVGIGTTGPDSTNKLTVAGDLAVHWASDTFIGMKYQAGATNKMGLVLNDGTRECKVLTKAADNDDKITFHTGSGPTERMRINSSGYTLINTTSNFDSAIFGVNGGNNAYIPIGCRVDQTTQASQIIFRNGNGAIGSISTSGSSTSYNTSSDYRLKENVVEVTDGIDRVKLLKPSKFNFIADPDKTVDGFLAHEVQDVVPEAISGTKDAMKTENVYDEDGNVTGTQQVPDYQGIDQSKLVPLLTAALQEAITKIESLEARVASLESV